MSLLPKRKWKIANFNVSGRQFEVRGSDELRNNGGLRLSSLRTLYVPRNGGRCRWKKGQIQNRGKMQNSCMSKKLGNKLKNYGGKCKNKIGLTEQQPSLSMLYPSNNNNRRYPTYPMYHSLYRSVVVVLFGSSCSHPTRESCSVVVVPF